MAFVYAPELFKKKRPACYTRERDRYLLGNTGVSPAILAAEMGVSERFVVTYQRKLGIRPFTGGHLWRKRNGARIRIDD